MDANATREAQFAGGAQLKAIGMSARQAIEAILERKVFMKLWSKVRDR